jgi:hypothetical protein
LAQAPNLALATLWADQLTAAGFPASVQRANACAIAGQIPPDQALPEIWIADASGFDAATAMLAELQHPPWRRFGCAGCGEWVDGPFEVCWNCGTARPE